MANVIRTIVQLGHWREYFYAANNSNKAEYVGIELGKTTCVLWQPNSCIAAGKDIDCGVLYWPTLMKSLKT